MAIAYFKIYIGAIAVMYCDGLQYYDKALKISRPMDYKVPARGDPCERIDVRHDGSVVLDGEIIAFFNWWEE